MFSITLLLSHLIGDFAFTNVFSEKFHKKDNTIYHTIWIILVFLGFNFDFLKSMTTIFIIIFSILLHVFWDFYRKKKESNPLNEFGISLLFLIVSFFSRNYFINSFLSITFQYYLLGLILVTGIATYLFRYFKIFPLEQKDTTGMTERMVIFIFIVNQMYLYALITAIVGIVYKYLFENFRKKEIFLSPIIGITFSILWLLLLLNI
ncbi:MAG: hypothetical protein ACQESN_04195 [Thermotogota bacterium]